MYVCDAHKSLDRSPRQMGCRLLIFGICSGRLGSLQTEFSKSKSNRTCHEGMINQIIASVLPERSHRESKDNSFFWEDDDVQRYVTFTGFSVLT